MRSLRNRGLVAVVTLALLASCSSGGGTEDDANGSTATSTAPDTVDAGGTNETGPVPLVQDLWLYHRIVTIDSAGDEVDLTDQVKGLMDGDPSESVDLGGSLTFHHHEEVEARLVDPDGEVRSDVAALAGLLDIDGETVIGVIATPEPDADAPISDQHQVQIDLTALEDVLSPGDPLLVDIGFVQAFGDGSDEEGLDGAALLGHRLAAGRVNVVGADEDGTTMLALSTELGAAVAGSVWAGLPAKSHRMMDGFTKGFQGCKFGLKCVKNYFDEMTDAVVDFGTAFDCNTGAGRCAPEPPDRTDPDRTDPDRTRPDRRPPRRSTPTRGAKVHGDPHMQTFDGHAYDMQAVGEFVAARSDDLEVQIRTSAVEGRTDVSLLSGVAVHVDGHTLSITGGGSHLDGEPLDPVELVEGLSLGDATLTARGNGFEIITESGQTVSMTSVSTAGFELWVGMDDDDTTDFVGLFGDNDRDASNDFLTRDGEVLDDPDFDALYGTFVEGWRLSDDESHFHYVDGEDTETFTDRSLPASAATLDSLPETDRVRAAALCRAMGIVDETTLDQCTLDYALTGEVGFVRAALTLDIVLGIWDGRLLEDGSDARSPGPDDGHGPDDEIPDTPGDLGDVRTVTAPWAMTAAEIREDDEFATRVTCPPNGAEHRVWGTDTYSDDSSVCTAAVHRGLVTYADGGEVLIEHRPGLGFYRGSTRNGVSTIEWDSWPGSFVFIGARGVAIEGDDP